MSQDKISWWSNWIDYEMNISWMLAIFVSEFPIKLFILGGSRNSKSYDEEFARVDRDPNGLSCIFILLENTHATRVVTSPEELDILVMFKLKMHLAPNFFRWNKSSCYSKNLSDLIESSIYFAASKLCSKCCATAFLRVCGWGCWWRLPEPIIHASIISLCFFRENGRRFILGLEPPRFVSELFLFCIWSQSFDSEMNFRDRASVLSALRAICNISRDDGEDFFEDELLVY